MTRIELPRKPVECPTCRHKPVATILYGTLAYDEAMGKQLEAGTLSIGGCILSDDDPAWECTHCGQKIHRTPNARRRR